MSDLLDAYQEEKRTARQNQVAQQMSVLTSMGSECWGTPPLILDRVRSLWNGRIGLDPCSSHANQVLVRADRYFTPERGEDGLALPWECETFFCNPPYGGTGRWMDWANEQHHTNLDGTGNAGEGVALVNSAPGYNWWERQMDICSSVMLRQRLAFLHPETLRPTGRAKKGQTLFYWGPRPRAFCAVFEDLGRARCL